MIALVQRVSEAAVQVGDEIAGQIGGGLLILLGVRSSDTEDEAKWLARKSASLRIFPDKDGKMNVSLKDAGGQALVVSQFTLYGNASKGNRPSFVEAAAPPQADALYEHYVDCLEAELGSKVHKGVFGAMMKVSLINDGPVTIILEKNSNQK